MALFTKVFSTKTLVLIACVLGGVLVMKSMDIYYGFSWADTLSSCATESMVRNSISGGSR